MLRLVLVMDGRNVVMSQKIADIDVDVAKNVIITSIDFTSLFNADEITEIVFDRYRVIGRHGEKRNIFLIFDRSDSRKEIEKQIQKLQL